MKTEEAGKRWGAWATLLAMSLVTAVSPLDAQNADYPDRVTIRRTSYGVPHILADDLGALGFGLAWVQLEDYGSRVVVNFMRGRGELSRYFGRDSIESDFAFARSYPQMVAGFPNLHQDTRDLFAGFAAGVNRYVGLHPEEFAGWDLPTYTAEDAAAMWTEETVAGSTGQFLRAQRRRRALADSLAALGEGSNAWALAPSRTTTGNAILLRNPHLNWRAGYYEAQITVPGVINFYGDFRIGYPLYFNGGFNDRLGWATTNNNPDLEEVYAIDVDSERPDHYLFDGESVPITRVPITVQWRNGPGLSSETREFWDTPLGPVVDRGEGKIYVLRSTDWGEYRKAEQFIRMMQAQNLAQWSEAMSMLAHGESNHTYADADGNIFLVWQAALPQLPHRSGGDTIAIPAATTADIWTDIVPWDELPHLLNPAGGYVQNSNDPPHFTNLNEIMDPADFPPFFPEPNLRLRSQHSLSLIGGDQRFTLEDVVRLKHDYTMWAAERFRNDLVKVIVAHNPRGRLREAVDLLEGWNNTTAPHVRGGTLFEAWYNRYTARDPGDNRTTAGREAALWMRPWSMDEPTDTPNGIADADRAYAAFEWAVEWTREQFGAIDSRWGDVHRARIGDLDLPVGGCPGGLGCFRVLYFNATGDGTRTVSGGDGWVFAVEFTPEGPRAYSVLAYGESSREDSPHHTDQLQMFVNGEMKTVRFSEDDIAADLVREYRPGR